MLVENACIVHLCTAFTLDRLERFASAGKYGEQSVPQFVWMTASTLFLYLHLFQYSTLCHPTICLWISLCIPPSTGIDLGVSFKRD
jgi:hypothetical protein